MIKVSEQRSAVRRAVLTKCADAYSDMLNGYADSYRGGITRAGARISVNDVLRKEGYKTQPYTRTATADTPNPFRAALNAIRRFFTGRKPNLPSTGDIASAGGTMPMSPGHLGAGMAMRPNNSNPAPAPARMARQR